MPLGFAVLCNPDLPHREYEHKDSRTPQNHKGKQSPLLHHGIPRRLNTPICILLSCDPDLEQAVRVLPGQAGRFCIRYCLFIFSVNMAVSSLYLISWHIQQVYHAAAMKQPLQAQRRATAICSALHSHTAKNSVKTRSVFVSLKRDGSERGLQDRKLKPTKYGRY